MRTRSTSRFQAVADIFEVVTVVGVIAVRIPIGEGLCYGAKSLCVVRNKNFCLGQFAKFLQAGLLNLG